MTFSSAQTGNMRKVIVLMLISFITVIDLNGQSVVKEEFKAIRTYPYSDPNPVPSFAINSMVSPFYPYYVFDGYTENSIQKEWKVITLENEFIEVTVLPGVGGKVWGAIEKSTGSEFIYMNHVMKFRAIGIRGPWTSGGIEHNFGLDLGHAPWTSSDVDYILKVDPDSSVSCIVGGLDLASRTQWRVNIKLPKDQACFETHSMLFNPTPLHDAYLSWENAGFKATDDLQFYFPGNYYIGHDGSVNSWPVDSEGRDLSYYRNNNFGPSKSYHVSGSYTDWFGGYWNDENFGFGHWTPYSDAPGKKIWIWSLARDGAIWENLLTDSDGQYIEAQSGVKFNQASPESGFNSPYNQLSIRPHYADTKSEYWFPVLKTRGMVDASSSGTLNVVRTEDSLSIFVCPNKIINDTLKVSVDGKLLYTGILRLAPMQSYHKTYYLSDNKKHEISVVLGRDLLSYNSDSNEKRIDRPVLASKEQKPGSAGHLFNLAADNYAMRNYEQALSYYMDFLKIDPDNNEALAKTAELLYRREEYMRGLEFAHRAMQNDTYHPAANFITGIIYRRLGDLMLAEEAFSIAARSMEYRSGAYLQIAGIRLQNQDFKNAVEYSKKALDFNRLNIQAWGLLATGYRKLSNYKESAMTLENLLEIDPLNHYARFEQYLLNPMEKNLNNFNSLIRNELPYESYLELAIEYANNGLNEEAIRVLEQSPEYPIVSYWLAYLYRDFPTVKSKEYLKKAESISPFLVFPHRLETIPVLKWAQEQNPSWKSGYYLGLIYWNIHKTEKAKELFNGCGNLPDYAPFYISRGILFQNDKSESEEVEDDFIMAQKLNSKEWRTWYYLSRFYEEKGDFDKQLETTVQMYPLFIDNPVIGISHARALLNTGKYQDCLKILAGVKILPQEGAQEGHILYETANLSLASEMIYRKKYKEALKYVSDSEKWPENLGAGKPYDPDVRFQDYISAFCYKKLGKEKLADECFDRIISFSESKRSNPNDPLNNLITDLVYNHRSRQKDGNLYIEKWKEEQDSLFIWKISSGSSSPRVKWVLSRCFGMEEKSNELQKEIESVPSEIRFRLFNKTISMINLNEEK